MACFVLRKKKNPLKNAFLLGLRSIKVKDMFLMNSFKSLSKVDFRDLFRLLLVFGL